MGAGSIGCFVGGCLEAERAAAVTFVGRPSLAGPIAAHGLTLRGFGREQHLAPAEVQFETEVGALEASQVVLCCVKSGATAAAAKALAEVLRPEAVVVSLQNGIRNAEILRRHLPRQRVVSAVVGFNVVIHEGAVFQQTTTGPLVVEAEEGSRDDPWIAALRSAGLQVELAKPIAPEQWTKLVVNLNNAISALSGAPTPAMLLSPKYRRAMTLLLDEALAVLHAAGIETAKFRGVPLRLMSRILKLPTLIVRLVLRAQLEVDPESRASMYQDLERGRKTEVDLLNGEIVRLAEACGVEAPLNRRIVALVHEAEDAGKGCPHLDADVLLAALLSGEPSG